MATAAEKAAAKRTEMLEALATLGVTDVTDEVSNEELAAKLKEAKAAAKAAAASGPIVINFRDHEGKPTSRTFSEEEHGEDFATLAEEFKTKHATRLIK